MTAVCRHETKGAGLGLMKMDGERRKWLVNETDWREKMTMTTAHKHETKGVGFGLMNIDEEGTKWCRNWNRDGTTNQKLNLKKKTEF